MKKKLYEVIKWGLLLIIAGVIFYFLSFKYYFPPQALGTIRCNKITGSVERFDHKTKMWNSFGDRKSKRR